MQTGFYCVVQFQPDRFRHEGVNVGVLVLAERDRELRFRFAETYERVRRMFPGLRIDDQRLAAAARALQRRLSEVDRTEEGIRGFIKKESSQLVIFPPLRASIDDIDATLDRIYKEFVEDPRATARITCPRCSFSFDPATSSAGPEVAPAQVLNKLPLRSRKPGLTSVPQPFSVAEHRSGVLFSWPYAASSLVEQRSHGATGMQRSLLSFLPLSSDTPTPSNVFSHKERWS